MIPSHAPSVDDLIASLSADLRPVRRLRAPWLRALVWLGCVAVLGAALASVADLAAVAARLASVPDMWLAVLGSSLTTVLAAWAAFELSVPDAPPAWAMVPLPGLALWIGASGLGCLRAWVVPETHPAAMGEMADCFAFIVGLSVPLSVLLLVMVRRACALRPNLTALTGGLAAAGASATLLTFFHPFDAGAKDLAVHAVAIVLVMGANRLLGGRLLGVPRSAPAG